MINEIVIGDGKHGISWVVCFRDSNGKMKIGHNSVSYSVHEAWLDIRLIVMKNTKEGECIKNAIERGVTPEKMDLYLMDMVLKKRLNRTIEACRRREKRFVVPQRAARSATRNPICTRIE